MEDLKRKISIKLTRRSENDQVALKDVLAQTKRLDEWYQRQKTVALKNMSSSNYKNQQSFINSPSRNRDLSAIKSRQSNSLALLSKKHSSQHSLSYIKKPVRLEKVQSNPELAILEKEINTLKETFSLEEYS